MAIHVFYANRHYLSVATPADYYKLNLINDPELYNGAYMFWQPFEKHAGIWYRPDFTPAYPPDITEEMKAYLLLLGAF